MDLNEMYHEGLGIYYSDIQEEDDIETLNKWRSAIEDDLNRMKLEIENAENRGAYLEEPIDSEWFCSIKYKKGVFAVLFTTLCSRIGQINRKNNPYKKETLQKKFEREFVNIAKEILKEDVFDEIKETALIKSGKVKVTNDKNIEDKQL